MASNYTRPTTERASELSSALNAVLSRVQIVAKESGRESDPPRLVAVSKYHAVEDIAACYEAGQLDFGENYVNELVDKAAVLPPDIRWCFIGTLQSNKCKTLAAIPNLFAIQTLDTTKQADLLNRYIPSGRSSQLHVYIQVNTSGESSKSGLPPVGDEAEKSEVAQLAQHILDKCPQLRLRGLMTIGSLEASTSSTDENKDFSTLLETRRHLQDVLAKSFPSDRWGNERGELELSMGMSADFESAIRAGSGCVRVGSSIFGTRPAKEKVLAAT